MPVLFFIVILPVLFVGALALLAEEQYGLGTLACVVLLFCVIWLVVAINCPIEVTHTQYVEAVHTPERSYIVYNYGESLRVSGVSGTAKRYRVDRLKTTYYGIDFDMKSFNNIKITPVIGDNQE
jgi:hypothetical protein